MAVGFVVMFAGAMVLAASSVLWVLLVGQLFSGASRALYPVTSSRLRKNGVGSCFTLM